MSDAPYDPSRHLKAGRGKVYASILDTIGDTPLVRLPRLSAELAPKAVARIPRGWKGGVDTDRIEVVGPLLAARRTEPRGRGLLVRGRLR